MVWFASTGGVLWVGCCGGLETSLRLAATLLHTCGGLGPHPSWDGWVRPHPLAVLFALRSIVGVGAETSPSSSSPSFHPIHLVRCVVYVCGLCDSVLCAGVGGSPAHGRFHDVGVFGGGCMFWVFYRVRRGWCVCMCIYVWAHSELPSQRLSVQFNHTSLKWWSQFFTGHFVCQWRAPIRHRLPKSVR